MTIEQFNTFLTSSELNDFMFPIKLVLILLCFIMICLITYYFVKQTILLGETKRKWSNFFSKQEFTVQTDLFNQWKEIKVLLPKEDQISYKLIISKSANLFYDVLEKSNLSDKAIDELDERHVPNIDDIREIVKISIRLKDEPTTSVDIQRVKELVSSLEETIKKLHLF
jgi:hypothetical protein